MRRDPLVTGEYYHIYNRGVDKRDIFMNKKDIERFALDIKEFNTISPVGSLRQKEKNMTDIDRLRDEDHNTLVSIACYCLNPNHFHFILKQRVDGGVSEFLKRLLGGYTMYFNKVHKRTGSLFQGRFKSKLIKDEEYFLRIRPYVNTNYLIHDIPEEKSHLVRSSCQEYDDLNFKLVAKEEAINLLEFYISNKNFKSECLRVTNTIREERGKISLDEKEEI